MKTSQPRRGRPPSPHAKSSAERMREYRARKRAEGLKHVGQWVPAGSAQTQVWSDHRCAEARSLALHCAIARKIANNPALLDQARNNLARWRSRHREHAPRYLDEWEELLDKPWRDVCCFITGFSTEAIRLRQSSPFAGVLTMQERKRIYDAFRA